MAKKEFTRALLAHWFYYWGCLISIPVWGRLGWGWLYKYYNKWMCKSVDYDDNEIIWKKAAKTNETNL